MATKIISPEEQLGYRVGVDRKLADWPEIVEYFTGLGRASPRVGLLRWPRSRAPARDGGRLR